MGDLEIPAIEQAVMVRPGDTLIVRLARDVTALRRADLAEAPG
jgi:hypothetical protein